MQKFKNQMYKLLHQARNAQGKNRHEILRELKELEVEGKVTSTMIIKVLENPEDLVAMDYAIGAIGRLRWEETYPLLKKVYQESINPLLLQSILDVFTKIGNDTFFEVVLEKIQKPVSNSTKKVGSSPLDNIFDEKQILDYILVPSLKYFQVCQKREVVKKITPYLEHPNSKVRWNALMVFDKGGFEIKEKILKKMKEKDPDILIRQQADIMLIKANK